MSKITEMQKQRSSVHPVWDDEDYAKRLQVDNWDSYSQLTKDFDQMCKGMGIDQLNAKLKDVEKAYEHVSNSLEAQKMRGLSDHPGETMKKTLYTKGLLADQIQTAKSYREKLLNENTINPISEEK